MRVDDVLLHDIDPADLRGEPARETAIAEREAGSCGCAAESS